MKTNKTLKLVLTLMILLVCSSFVYADDLIQGWYTGTQNGDWNSNWGAAGEAQLEFKANGTYTPSQMETIFYKKAGETGTITVELWSDGGSSKGSYLSTLFTVDVAGLDDTGWAGDCVAQGCEFSNVYNITGEYELQDGTYYWIVVDINTSAQKFFWATDANYCSATGTDYSGSDYTRNTDYPSNCPYFLLYDDFNNNFSITSTQTNTFNATINGTLYQTTNGTINTPFLISSGDLVNITIVAEDYFNYNYFNYNVSSPITETSLYQAELKLRAFELLTGSEVTANFTINGTTKLTNETFKLLAGVYNVTFSGNGYYNKTEQLNITALQNSTESITGVYNSIISVKAWDNFTSQHINTFNAVLDADNYATNSTGNTTNGTLTFNAVQGEPYTVYIYADNFANANATITPNNSTELVNISVEKFNSVSINIYDQINDSLLNGTNVSISFIADDGQETNTTSTGTFYKYNLTAGDYQIKFTSSGYEISNYYITVSNFSTQSLNAYLLPTGVDETIFTFKDRNLETVITDVSLSIEQIINDEWVLINVLTSDVSGRIVFNYQENAEYRFSTSNSNYEDKSFTLDPIIFASYTIWLDKIAVEQEDQDLSRITIKYTPSEYYNDANNTFEISFISPTGELQEYGYNLTYKNVSISGDGTNAIGGILTDVLTIEGAITGDRVILNYYYRLSDGQLKEYTIPYTIYNIDDAGTFSYNKGETYGLGLFERALIAVIVVIIVAGAAFLFGGLLSSGIMAMFIFGYMNYIGFLSAWLTIPSMIIIFITTAWGATR